VTPHLDGDCTRLRTLSLIFPDRTTMNVPVETTSWPALLFVRSQAELHLALDQVNRLLAFRRRRRHAGCDDRILAVWFRRDLDTGLFPLRASSEQSESADLSIAISESFSLSGIWTLLWIKSPAFCGMGDGIPQREAILRSFASATPELDSPGSFCPVFTENQSPESVATETKRLKAACPELVGPIILRQDLRLGVYPEDGVLP